MKNDFRGIWKTRHNHFVFVEKYGSIEISGKRMLGYLGKEILLNGTIIPGWIPYNTSGLSRVRDWDLMQRKRSVESVSVDRTIWPQEPEIVKSRPDR